VSTFASTSGRIIRNETLAVAEATLRKSLKSPDASPFLGQRELPERARLVLEGNLIDDRPVDVLEAFFKSYPALTVAFIAGMARRETGQKGEGEFYPHLEAQLEIRLSSELRRRVHAAFRGACSKLGLRVLTKVEQEDASTWFRVADYAMQAGPLDIHLSALARACLDVEGDLGPLDPFDTDGSLQWHAHLVEQLATSGTGALERVINLDRLAWHARAFARLSQGFPAVIPFEVTFAAEISKARSEPRSARRGGGPRVSLGFQDDELLLSAPPSAPGWLWSVDGGWGEHVVLRTGESIPLSCEQLITVTATRDYPAEMDTAAKVQAIPIWTHKRLLVFEGRTGRLVGQHAPAGPLSIIAERQFEAAGMRAARLPSGLWRLGLDIQDGETLSVMLANGPIETVVGHRESLIEWASTAAVKFDGKPAFGRLPLVLSVSLSKESAAGWGEMLEVELRTPEFVLSRSPVIFTSPEEGTAVFDVAGLGTHLSRLTAALVKTGESRPLLLAPSAFLWPGLVGFEDGLLKGPVPSNFDAAASVGVQPGALGIAVTADSKRWPEVAFLVDGGRHVRFRVKRPGLFVELEEGPERQAFEVGSLVIDDGRPKYLRVSFDDPLAAIKLPNGLVENAFASSGFRRVPLLGLADSQQNEVIVWPRGDRARALTLARVTKPCTPTAARLLKKGGRPVLEIEIAEPVAAFELVGTDLLSGDRRYVRAGEGLEQECSGGKWSIWPEAKFLPDGAWVFEARGILVDHELPRPLRSDRGDRFGMALSIFDGGVERLLGLLRPPIDTPAAEEVFERVSQQLMVCWSECCWAEGVGDLDDCWMQLGADLACRASSGDAVAAAALLRVAGLTPPTDTSHSWVPLRHPVEVWPGLFAADLSQTAAVLSDADDEGARTLAQSLVADDDGDASLRHNEACRKFGGRLERASREGMNSRRLSYAAWVCNNANLLMRRRGDGRHIPEVPTDESDRAAILQAAPALFSEFVKAAEFDRVSPGVLAGWLNEISKGSDRPDPRSSTLSALGLLCRLGPELLAWHLKHSHQFPKQVADVTPHRA
jgi:hypothetical protein